MPSEFSGRIQLRQELLFWITAGVLLFVFLDTSSFRESEAFRAEAFREMLLAGNLFQPLFNWENIYDVSFLSYWLLVPFVKVFGFTEFAFRLPGVFAALAALYGVRMTGRGLFDEKSAFLCSWLFLGSVAFLLWGRTGNAEIGGVAGAICAVGWYFRSRHNGGFVSWLVFYMLCFAGAFCSGLPALLVPAAVVLPLSLCSQKKCRNEIWKNASAFLLAAFIFAVAFHLPVFFLVVPGEEKTSIGAALFLFFKQNLREIAFFLRQFDWKEYFFNLGVFLPKVLLPWSPLLLAGCIGLLKNWKQLSSEVKITLISVTAAALLCPLTGMKNSLLPVAPLVLILGGGGIVFAVRQGEKWSRWVVAGACYIMITAASAAFCSFAVYPLWGKLTVFSLPPSLMLWTVAAGAAAWFALFLDHRRNNVLTVVTGLPHRLGSTILAGTVLTGCCMSVLQPVIHSEFGCDKKFFEQLHSLALRELHGYASERIVFYRTPVPGGFLFYNRLFSPVSHTASVKETALRFPDTKVIFVLKEEPALLEEFQKECSRLNTAPLAVSLSPVRSLCCGGEVHYSVFPAVLPQISKQAAPHKEMKNENSR